MKFLFNYVSILCELHMLYLTAEYCENENKGIKEMHQSHFLTFFNFN